MTIGIWVLGDQLSLTQAALQGERAPVILIESSQHVQERSYHRQKLVLVWSAMRHFAAELRQAGWDVSYEIAENFESPLRHWIKTYGITELRLMQPNDRPFAQWLASLELPCKITLVPNNLFLWTANQFQAWAKGCKNLLMEYFYREGRQRYQILMQGKHPVGGVWNLDKQNRKPPKGKLNPPKPLWFEPDAMTQDVIDWVKSGHFSSYGTVEPFRWGVTRSQALQVLEHFLTTRLSMFGPYQDAMLTGEETLWHGLLSPYLNLGLLHPLEVIRAAEQAYYDQQLDLNSVEGFIRQILGWREYMHGLYHYVDDDYPQRNWFNHTQPLPPFFWDASQTDMNCLHQTLQQVEATAYGHHIQRLMVLSNFALIAGLSPQQVENWFHAAFIDAYDWVMQTNVIGMGLFADGGILASKPYAASANYINRMSDYCKTCAYSPTARTGARACPFNFFYWDFLDRHRDKLQSQGRMSFILKNLDQMRSEELEEIRLRAREWGDEH
ncbi:cryptochrome/photolyase family protein [Leptolyngbya sp. NK1-12]|uniref:Cryptochrome/photolyase family protein n=1 Tax=Leptolyngbya sp. NK1-12 TaxID=2547451 RepID=A0AA96WVD4_9CYAN|nr:cryptochrome/photolyase family protein [Leptolyngbya sp. NK1-12]